MPMYNYFSKDNEFNTWYHFQNPLRCSSSPFHLHGCPHLSTRHQCSSSWPHPGGGNSSVRRVPCRPWAQVRGASMLVQDDSTKILKVLMLKNNGKNGNGQLCSLGPKLPLSGINWHAQAALQHDNFGYFAFRTRACKIFSVPVQFISVFVKFHKISKSMVKGKFLNIPII